MAAQVVRRDPPAGTSPGEAIDATPLAPARQRARRRLVALVATLSMLAALTLLLAIVAGSALAEGNGEGPPTLADRIEQVIRQDERLHYHVHMTLGRVLSLCPCTRGKSAEQYRKASFHAPDEVRARNTLIKQFPHAVEHVDALIACQVAVRAQLAGAALEPQFPEPRTLTIRDLEAAVVPEVGTTSVIQQFLVRPATSGGSPAPAPAPDASQAGQSAQSAQSLQSALPALTAPQTEALYTCSVRKNALGSWQVVALDVLQ